jgi:putative DNA primase/helicase
VKDLLQEWVDGLPAVPVSALLTTWLRQYANVPDTVSDAYVADVSRLMLVSIIARILHPGCQYRCVPFLEGPEDAGKSNLAKVLAGEDPYGHSWHVALSAGLESKEAHMMLEGALVAELEELSSYTKTDENRMKALVTMQADSFVPKFSNKRVDHPRRTVFIATVNPEGAGDYLKGQSGNTRWLPIRVGTINIAQVQQQREALFAEAKAYYLAHPADWWRLASDEDAANEREHRRQPSLYETEGLKDWLRRCSLRTPAECTWQDIAEQHLQIPKDRWNKATAMEIAKALKAFKWEPQRTKEKRYWTPP